MRKDKLIVLVDDDDLDAMIVQRCLGDLAIDNHLVHHEDAEVALTYLRQCLPALPSFILLDINMPGMDGFDFLREIKADRDLRDIPVLMLTTSNAEEDKKRSLELGAAEYIVKNPRWKDFMKDLRRVETYCQGVCT